MTRRIIVAAGDPGTGKSRFCMDVEEPIEFWDCENKNEELQLKNYSHKIIHRKDLLAYDKGFMEDYYATYVNLQKEVTRIIELGKAIEAKKKDYIGFESLVIDGISFIRNKCMLAKWLHEHQGRKQPNEFEYKDINRDTQLLLWPLVNMVIKKIIPTLIFTAEFKNKYIPMEVFDETRNKLVTKSVKSGREPAYEDYLGYKGYTLLELYSDVKTKKYKVLCTKSLAGVWDAAVTGNSIYDVLLEKSI